MLQKSALYHLFTFYPIIPSTITEILRSRLPPVATTHFSHHATGCCDWRRIFILTQRAADETANLSIIFIYLFLLIYCLNTTETTQKNKTMASMHMIHSQSQCIATRTS